MTAFDIKASMPNTTVRRTLIAGGAATTLLVGTLGGWSATTPIASAVVVQGQIIVEGRKKQVQHRDGGVVSKIAASNGDYTKAGDVLIKLDGSETKASLEIVQERLAAATALYARLRAEKEGRSTISLTPKERQQSSLYIEAALTAQSDILQARTEVSHSNKARLEETIAQIDQEKKGLAAQIISLKKEIGYIQQEIEIIEPLFKKNLVNHDRISQLHRIHADRTRSLSALQASKNILDNRQRDAVIQNRQTEDALHEKVVTEIQDVIATIGQLKVEQAALQDRMARIEIRAPESGIVHEMQVTTIGGVIAPGATVLEIVPQDRAAAVEVRVPPDKVDEIYPGQTAELVLSGPDQQSRGQLLGTVHKVSAAAVRDPQTGRDFFRVEISVNMEDFAKADIVPVPGMPLEIYITTGEHTVLSYLVEPVSSQFRRAFRE